MSNFDQEGPKSTEASSSASPRTSPLIKSISWGRIDVDGIGEVKDVKLWPGGGRAWDWGETNTRHDPGIQLVDIDELLKHGATVLVLSRGMESRLGVADIVVNSLRSRGLVVHVDETKAAVSLYNTLRLSMPVGGLFHSTC